MAKKNGKGFWIVNSEGQYLVLSKEPTNFTRDPYIGVACHSGYVMEFCSQQFEKLTGLKLKDGEFCHAELKVVGDIWESTVEEITYA